MRMQFDLWSRVSCGGDGGSGGGGSGGGGVPDYATQAGGGTNTGSWAAGLGSLGGSDWAERTGYTGPVEIVGSGGQVVEYVNGQPAGSAPAPEAAGGITSVPVEQPTRSVAAPREPVVAAPTQQMQQQPVQQVAPVNPQSPTLNPHNVQYATDEYEPGYTSVLGGGILEAALDDAARRGDLNNVPSPSYTAAQDDVAEGRTASAYGGNSYAPNPVGQEIVEAATRGSPVSGIGWSAPAYGDQDTSNTTNAQSGGWGLESANIDYGPASGPPIDGTSTAWGLENANVNYDTYDDPDPYAGGSSLYGDYSMQPYQPEAVRDVPQQDPMGAEAYSPSFPTSDPMSPEAYGPSAADPMAPESYGPATQSDPMEPAAYAGPPLGTVSPFSLDANAPWSQSAPQTIGQQNMNTPAYNIPSNPVFDTKFITDIKQKPAGVPDNWPQMAVSIVERGRARGYTEQGIAAVLGHVKKESGFIAGNVDARKRGENSIGSLQWNTAHGRQRDMLEAAKSRGVSWDDPNFQADYIFDEIEGKSKGMHSDPRLEGVLKDPNVSPSVASRSMFEMNVRASDRASIGQRAAYAEDYTSQLKNSPVFGGFNITMGDLNPTRQMDLTEVGGDIDREPTGGGLSAIGPTREYSAPASVYEAPSGWSPPAAQSNFGSNIGNLAVGTAAKLGIGAVAGPIGTLADFGIGALTGRSVSGRIADAVMGPRQGATSPYTDYALALDPSTPLNTPLSRSPDQTRYDPSVIPDYRAPNPDISGSRFIDDARVQLDDGTYSAPYSYGDPTRGINQYVNAPSADRWAEVSGLRDAYGQNSLAASQYDGMRTGNSNEAFGINPQQSTTGASTGADAGTAPSTTAPPPAPIAIAGQNVRNQPVFPNREVPEPYRSMLIQSGYGLDGMGGWNFFPESGRQRAIPMATGGLVQGAGTETSDSVPAIIDGKTPAALSSGEFVFTGAAVRGMGDGDRMEGARRLHSMMKKAEARAGKQR
jgi:hypothetical protein